MQINHNCSELQLEHELNMFFNNDKARLDEWLDTPIPRLDGQCPRDLLFTEEKRRELLTVLQEMKLGEMA